MSCVKLKCFTISNTTKHFHWNSWIPYGGSRRHGKFFFLRHFMEANIVMSVFFSFARLYHYREPKFLQELWGLIGCARTTLGMPSVGHRQRAPRQPMQSLQAVCTPSVLWQYDERNTFTLIILPFFSEVSFLLPVVPLSMKKTNIQDIANLA